MASEWMENPGRLIDAVKGKRVEVELFNGVKPKESWPADGRDRTGGKTDWRISDPPHPFQIRRFRVL